MNPIRWSIEDELWDHNPFKMLTRTWIESNRLLIHAANQIAINMAKAPGAPIGLKTQTRTGEK